MMGTAIITDDIRSGDLPFEKCAPLIINNLHCSSLPIIDEVPNVQPQRNNRQTALHIAEITFGCHELPNFVSIAG